MCQHIVGTKAENSTRFSQSVHTESEPFGTEDDKCSAPSGVWEIIMSLIVEASLFPTLLSPRQDGTLQWGMRESFHSSGCSLPVISKNVLEN